MNIFLKCRCGEFRGVIEKFSSREGGRAVCYCDDCQAYMHALGRSHDLLNEWGGTDITPVLPKQLKIVQGKVALFRLSKDGLYRFFADCCQSPIANAPNASLPYLGLMTTITDLSSDERDEMLGRIRFGLQSKDAIGSPPPPKSKGVGFAAMKWMIGFLSKAFFKGGAKPHPFFNEQGQPIVAARILSQAERDHLRQFCGPNPTANPTVQ